MELVAEFIFSILFEGTIEAMGNRKVPLLARLLCAVLFVGFFGGVMLLLMVVGIDMVKTGNTRGWIMIGCAIAMIVCIVLLYRSWHTKHLRK